ncbi:GntR family transcriptional regulator [Fibrobacter sp. UWB12]|uniref:GntR family transcriptional regulator n=1 Tax=Fibrobacter sp. UWB12 TaxID=1896203 RepID=UPI00090ECF0D|nr:GntR family transcriptional regulator [Fibrobacter sp. UWB12]SHK63228.1 regulatory protein, gntR family [Fibrobacter sp. UWB12]
MLIEDVKKSIVNAGFQDGEKMPSVRKMAERLGLSVNTVHRAYKLLSADGRIQLVHGKGCFWGSAPSFEVKPEESVYSVVERLFQNDLDSGVLNAFDELPSCKELSNRYGVSPYIVKKFLMQKSSQGILRHVGHRFFFSEERTVGKSNYVLFVHRSDEFGRLKIESERESDVFRTFAQIAAEQKIAVKFIGYHEASNQFFVSDGSTFSIKNDTHCLGVFLSTWLVNDASKLFAHFAMFKNPISVWWEYAPDMVPVSARNRKKWAFYNVAFGKEAGVIVGRYLKNKNMGPVHYLSPYHASFWSKARLQGLIEAGAEVVPLVDERFASPFDLMDVAKNSGIDSQKFLDNVLGELLKSATLDKFVCSNDWVAASLIDYFKAKKLPAPYVVGFDDTIESYRYVFDSFAFNVGTMVKEAIYHIVAPTIYAEQRRQMQTPLGRVVEKH